MKKLFGLAVASVMLIGAASVYAGGACCAKGEQAKAEVKKAGCAWDTANLKLTDDQQVKVAALRNECDKSGCTKEAHDNFTKGLKEILTAEQYTQWQAECDKAGSCPYKKSADKAGDKSS